MRTRCLDAPTPKGGISIYVIDKELGSHVPRLNVARSSEARNHSLAPANRNAWALFTLQGSNTGVAGPKESQDPQSGLGS